LFGWFRKNEKQVPDEDIIDAYELGRRTAQSANADIEAYMQARFYPGITKIADAVLGNLESPDLPPLVLARIDLKSFLEHLDGDLRPRIMPQLRSAMAGWISIDGGVGSEIERLIEHHYDQLKSSLALAAFQRLLDMADTVKEADDQWRAANPEKAANIPLNLFGPELGDLLAPYVKA
jgi:hypothetical protein